MSKNGMQLVWWQKQSCGPSMWHLKGEVNSAVNLIVGCSSFIFIKNKSQRNTFYFPFPFLCLKSSASSRGKSQTLPLIKPKNKCTRHLYKHGNLKSDGWILQVLPSNFFWIRTNSTSPSTNEKTSLVTMYPNFCPLFLYVFNNSIF